MNKNIVLLIVLSFSLIISCNQDGVIKYGEQRILDNTKSYFNDTIWKGLPNEISKNVRVISNYFPLALEVNMNYFGIFLLENIDEDRKSSFINYTYDNVKTFSKINKIENLIETRHVSEFKIKGLNEGITDSTVYVYPDFQEEYSPVREYLNSSNWSLAIMDSQFGSFIDNDILEHSKSAKYHGFSKGFFINEGLDSMIFWFIGW
jgi:hypothetical protein